MEVKKTAIRKKRISRHKKGHWKKQVDIADVEEYLDDQRLEERIGKPSEKPDAELFFESNKSSLEEEKTAGVKREDKPLKCYRHLLQDIPQTPAFDSKGNERIEFHPVNKRLTYKLKGWTKKNKEREFKNPDLAVKARNQRIQNRKNGIRKYTDLWNVDGVVTPVDDITKYHLQQTKKLVRPLPERMRLKPSKLPAVQVPHPGASYNPAVEDHQALLQKAHKKELLKDEETKYIQRNLTPKLKEGETLATEESKLEEMSEGLFAKDDESSEDEDEGEEQYPVHPASTGFNLSLSSRGGRG